MAEIIPLETKEDIKGIDSLILKENLKIKSIATNVRKFYLFPSVKEIPTETCNVFLEKSGKTKYILEFY